MTDTTPQIVPKSYKGFNLYPATFGLITWLADHRKNPAVIGEPFGLDEVAELCFAFTHPSREVAKLTDAKLREGVNEFMHDMTPEVFTTIQKHAETELLKYFARMTKPKKKAPKKRAKKA